MTCVHCPSCLTPATSRLGPRATVAAGRANVKIHLITAYAVIIISSKIGKSFLYSIPSIGPGADPGVQAVSLQVTVSHPPGGRLPLLSARPAVTSPAAEHHRPLAGTKLYCLLTEAHRCKQLA